MLKKSKKPYVFAQKFGKILKKNTRGTKVNFWGLPPPNQNPLCAAEHKYKIKIHEVNEAIEKIKEKGENRFNKLNCSEKWHNFLNKI